MKLSKFLTTEAAEIFKPAKIFKPFDSTELKTIQDILTRVDAKTPYEAFITTLKNGKFDLAERLVKEAGVKVNGLLDGFKYIPKEKFDKYDLHLFTQSPLHIVSGIPKAIRFLIKMGADVNIQNPLGETPLFWAIGEYDIESVKVLLKAGARLDITTREGVTPLSFAEAEEQDEIFDILRKAGAKRHYNKINEAEIFKPFDQSKINTLDEILDRFGPDMYEALHTCAAKGLTKFCKIILNHLKKHKFSITQVDSPSNYNGWGTPLLLACRYGHKDVVKLLLDYGCDPNQMEDEEGPLYVTVWNSIDGDFNAKAKYYEIAEMLVRAGAKTLRGVRRFRCSILI